MADRDEPTKRLLRRFQERQSGHEEFCRRVEKRHRAYLGILDSGSQAAQWTSKLAPPYAMQIAETVAANLTDGEPRFNVKPRPRLTDVEDLERTVLGAKALEILLNYQLKLDRFAEKQRPFALQAVIAGLTVGKTYWLTDTGTRKTLQTVPVLDDLGMQIGEELKEVETEVVRRDDPTFEVLRVEDFLWDEAADDIQQAQFLIHRSATTLDDLRRLQKQGVYRNVGKLDQPDEGIQDEFTQLMEQLTGDKRFRGKIELLEMWWRLKGRVHVTTIANRRVLLADRETPFSHNQYPFVACSTAPAPFRIPGYSTVEKIQALQEYLWTLMNQRLDNLALLNNAIFAYRDDILDRDQFEFFPGAMWPVSGDVEQSIKQFTPDPTVGSVSLQAESLIKGDMQNITGGMPFMSGTDSSTIDQKTATGVSIVTTLAQRMLASQKQQLTWAYERLAEQWVDLDQQFMRDERLIPIVGPAGALAFKTIQPDLLEGDYHVTVQAATESMMRQERRAEAQAKLQVALQAAPIMQAVGSPMNLRAFAEDFLRAFDTEDVDRYFMPSPPQGAGQAPGPTPPGGGPAPPQQNGQGGGVTAPQAAGPGSPSNPASQSPAVFMQRALAQRGGPNNAA